MFIMLISFLRNNFICIISDWNLEPLKIILNGMLFFKRIADPPPLFPILLANIVS